MIPQLCWGVDLMELYKSPYFSAREPLLSVACNLFTFNKKQLNLRFPQHVIPYPNILPYISYPPHYNYIGPQVIDPIHSTHTNHHRIQLGKAPMAIYHPSWMSWHHGKAVVAQQTVHSQQLHQGEVADESCGLVLGSQRTHHDRLDPCLILVETQLG